MGTKHTPGPWVAVRINDKNDYAVDTENSDWRDLRRIALLITSGGKNKENAALIAAAPDLLDACVTIVLSIGERERMDVINAHTLRAAHEKAKAAIAKATGGA